MSKDIAKSGSSPRDWFGNTLVKLADEGMDFLTVDTDTAGGTGLWIFRDKYPDRVIQCGISEQAAMAIAAGLADGKQIPIIFSSFASFAARAWEIARLQVFYNDLPVIIAMSHVGIDVGPDGPSNASLEHYALWGSLPDNYPIFHPSCPNEMEGALRHLLGCGGPGVLFTGRSSVELGAWADRIDPISKPIFQTVATFGNDEKFDIQIVSAGHMVSKCVLAAFILYDQNTNFRIGVYSYPDFSKGIYQKFNNPKNSLLVTVEDHTRVGGLNQFIRSNATVLSFFVDEWGQSGDPPDLFDHYGLSPEKIAERVIEVVNG